MTPPSLLPGLYCGPAPLPPQLWSSWNLDPALLAGLLCLAFALRRSRSGLLGVGALAVAFVSPLCALSAALFSARVVHHVILVVVAAPLLALAWPLRRPTGGLGPLLAFTATLWAWHLPLAYDWALRDVAAYWLMQGTLLLAATLFWRAVLAPEAAGGPLLVLAAWMQMGFLGALLTFAPGALYAAHAVAPLAWGFSPLGDQQLGGLVMWVPAGLPFAAWGAVAARRQWRRLAAADFG